MRDLVIFGAGGFAREVHQVVSDLNQERPSWNVLGFLDDDVARHGEELHDLPVLGDAAWLRDRPEVSVAVAIGGCAARRKVVTDLADAGCSRFPALIHPLARGGRGVQYGAGAIVCAGNLLTTDLRIGEHVILNLACTIGHDVTIERFATLSPGVHVSGGVAVGEGDDLGTGCTIVQGCSIGAWSVIGAGAVVTRDIPANVTAVGVPARPIKERPAGWHLE